MTLLGYFILLLVAINSKADLTPSNLLTNLIERYPTAATVGFYCDEMQKKGMLSRC